eukprot:m.452459 g.452459  ORF g.452459 m.452459 type:complete len:494 (-) comp20331_c0_seq1:35-1516(-)
MDFSGGNLAVRAGADSDTFHFTIEKVLDEQAIDWNLPFPDMDKSCEDLCRTFKRTRRCHREAYCPYRHTVGEKDKVCKHWLRGLCKKGDQCDFLHRYDLSRMPECYFFSTYGECNNDECIFLHIDPEKRKVECPWYARGFCRHGGQCKNRHTRKVLCQKYLAGFCPDGPDCKRSHPSWEIPVETRGSDGTVTSSHRLPSNRTGPLTTRPLDEVTCHKCRQMGHYADKCPNPRVTGPVLPAATGPEVTRVVKCPNNKVGLIIGKGGATHRSLQESTHCKVHIPKESEPGVDYREIVITGGEEQATACEKMIVDKIGDSSSSSSSGGHKEQGGIRPGEIQAVVQCPNENVGMIIGKQGATFRMLQETTGCHVNIPKASAPGAWYREITLTGTQSQVEHCRGLIMEKLESKNPGIGARHGAGMPGAGPHGMHGFPPMGMPFGAPGFAMGGAPMPHFGAPPGFMMHGHGPPMGGAMGDGRGDDAEESRKRRHSDDGY